MVSMPVIALTHHRGVVMTHYVTSRRIALIKELSKKSGRSLGSLAQAAGDLRRSLPRSTRRDCLELEAINRRIQHPKRRGFYDPKQVARLERQIRFDANRLNMQARRNRSLLNWFGTNVINLMLFTAILLLTLNWMQ